jgi:hypothetical protein
MNFDKYTCETIIIKMLRIFITFESFLTFLQLNPSLNS